MGLRDWDLDIDRYLNRILPASPLHKIPTPISRWLGYRTEQRQDVGNILGAFWSLVGAFCGLAVIAAVFNNTGVIHAHHPPALIASFGASAVLNFNTIRSPLGQPRNAILGHTLSALIGVSISKLFQHHADYDSISWVAGSLACGIASAVMLLTGTVHPPGGASAVLATTDPVISAMGWYFVGLVTWGATLMVIVGLVVNNVQRQFPVYWWTGMDLRRAKVEDSETVQDARGGIVRREMEEEEKYDQDNERIYITGAEVQLPDGLSMNAEETRTLEMLRERLRQRVDGRTSGDGKDSMSERSSADFTMVPSRSEFGDVVRS